MDNVVSIVNSKESKLDFDIGIEGLEPKNIKVRLLIETKNFDFAFSCKKEKGKTWGVTIPALEYIEKGTYPLKVEVIADGYHFEAMKGIANVTGSFDIYAKKSEKIKPIEEKKIKIGEIEERRERTNPLSGMNNLADKIFSEYTKKPKVQLVTENREEKKEEKTFKSKDDIIRNILRKSSATESKPSAVTFTKGKIVQY